MWTDRSTITWSPPCECDPPLTRPADPDHLRIRKFEELYGLAKAAFVSDAERLNAAEEKASRYLQILALVLGLNAAGFQEFVARAWPMRSVADGTFATAFVLGSVCNALAVWYLFRALAVTKVFALPADRTLLDHFWSYGYEDAIYGMTRSYLDATQGMRKHVDAKLRWVRHGFRWLSYAMVAAVICVASFTVARARESKMTDTENTPSQPASTEAAPTPSAPAADGGAAPQSAGPNPAVTGPVFVQLDRSLRPDTIKTRDSIPPREDK